MASPRSPRTRAATTPAPRLQRKAQPRQQRALDTYELILDATVALLSEVGIERLSTNLVCQRAGISPPALYRYFPNKYALLRELGQRLMQAQNALVVAWAVPETMALPADALVQKIYELYEHTLVLTRELPEGLWVTRALRAVPALAHVRIESHAHVSGLITRAFLQAHPQARESEVAVLARLAVEMVYAAMEMLFDDPRLDEKAVGQALADMLAQRVLAVRSNTLGNPTR
ncbi:MAG: TetR/AcrR family transcriptional regulator [Rhodoferax sp.]